MKERIFLSLNRNVKMMMISFYRNSKFPFDEFDILPDARDCCLKIKLVEISQEKKIPISSMGTEINRPYKIK